MKILPKQAVLYFVLLIILACYASFFTRSFTFEPKYALYSDSVYLYPMQHLLDPTLFVNDVPVIELCKFFNTMAQIREYTHFKVYQFLTLFSPYTLAIKIYCIILCILSTIFIFGIGLKFYNKDCAYLLSTLFIIYFLSMNTFFGIHDRSFGAFLFCAFLFFLAKKRFVFLPLTVLLSIIFFSQIFVSLTVICILVLYFYRTEINYKRFIPFLCLAILSFLVFVLFDGFLNAQIKNIAILRSYKFANIINPASLRNIFLFFIFNFEEHSRLYGYFTKFFIGVSLMMVIFRGRRAFHLPLEIYLMILGSLISFLITYPIHPVLASRQLVFSLPLFLIFFITTNLFDALKGKKLKCANLIMPTIFIFVIMYPFFNKIHDGKQDKPIFDFIERLPKDVVVAGFPDSQTLARIPLFSKRSIFLADKMVDIFYLAYGPEKTRRMRDDLIRALYADTIEGVRDFIRRYPIDYLLIDVSFYKDEYFRYLDHSIRPFDRQTLNIIDHMRNKDRFLLLEFARKNHDFSMSGSVFIVNSKKIMQSQQD